MVGRVTRLGAGRVGGARAGGHVCSPRLRAAPGVPPDRFLERYSPRGAPFKRPSLGGHAAFIASRAPAPPRPAGYTFEPARAAGGR